LAPTKEYAGDAGFDLTVVKWVKNTTGTTALYDTCVKICPPAGYYSEVVPRSSISSSGYTLANCVGVIDAGYRGTIKVALTKTDPQASPISLPFKCAQLIFRKLEPVALGVEVAEWSVAPTDGRGEGGFGSTNKNFSQV
jgi:dUTP pyrophosphatase